MAKLARSQLKPLPATAPAAGLSHAPASPPGPPGPAGLADLGLADLRLRWRNAFGVVPLGYRVEMRKLVVDADEAAVVNLIFTRYLALGSLPALQRDLSFRGVVTRARKLADGRIIGGGALTNGPLAHILKNRVYRGEINHRGKSYPGAHDPIIAAELFDAVQTRLAGNRVAHHGRHSGSQALLIGRLVDDRGNKMSPSHASKNGVRYRYYVSQALQQGRTSEAG